MDGAPYWIDTPPPPPKFQHRYVTHIALFLLTLLSTTYFGRFHYAGFQQSIGFGGPDLTLGPWITGLAYAIPILAILGAHEFGHYWYCRLHNVDATLPYFLPAPLPLTGTLGAVIRIKEPFPSRRALFDIGVAGPIAGFLVLLPFLYWGVTLSVPVRFPQTADVIYFGEPLLFKFFSYLHFGTLPEGFDIAIHPVAFAAWFGMLATALNLLPFGQLDGGHISYALFGPRARFVSIVTLAGTLLLTLRSLSWISMALMMLAMAFFLGVRHPPVPDDGVPLGSTRQLVGLFALAMFVLCFTPVPIETFF